VLGEKIDVMLFYKISCGEELVENSLGPIGIFCHGIHESLDIRGEKIEGCLCIEVSFNSEQVGLGSGYLEVSGQIFFNVAPRELYEQLLERHQFR
jgi:hypothetical protein